MADRDEDMGDRDGSEDGGEEIEAED